MWLVGTRDEKLPVWNWTGWRLGMGNEIGASGDSLQYRCAIILCIMVYGFKDTTAKGLEACVL
jgi:hypothetical protein